MGGKVQGAELASSEARASLLSGDTEEQSRWAEGKDLNGRDTLTDGYKTLPIAGHAALSATGPAWTPLLRQHAYSAQHRRKVGFY